MKMMHKKSVHILTAGLVVLSAAALLSVGAFAAEVDVNEDPTIAGYLPPQSAEVMVQGDIALHSAVQEELPYGGYAAPLGDAIQGDVMLIGVEDLTETAKMPTVEIKMTGLLRKSILYTASQQGRVLTVAAPEKYAVLRFTVEQAKELMEQGVSTVVLVTENKSTTLNLTLLCDGYKDSSKVVLRHYDDSAVLTVGGRCRRDLLIGR